MLEIKWVGNTGWHHRRTQNKLTLGRPKTVYRHTNKGIMCRLLYVCIRKHKSLYLPNHIESLYMVGGSTFHPITKLFQSGGETLLL